MTCIFFLDAFKNFPLVIQKWPRVSLIIPDRNSPLAPFQKVAFNYILDDCYCFTWKQLLKNSWTCLKLFPTHNHSQSRPSCLVRACSYDTRGTLLSSTLRPLTLVSLPTRSSLGSALCLGPCDLCFSEAGCPIFCWTSTLFVILLLIPVPKNSWKQAYRRQGQVSCLRSFSSRTKIQMLLGAKLPENIYMVNGVSSFWFTCVH